jgi:ABC-type branched-subunit amino acid transport system substrate-binding protein
MRLSAFVLVTGSLLLAAVQPAIAQKKYGPGITVTEIKLGQTMPYSGAASGVGSIGRAQTAYFRMINARGDVNGCKVNFILLDDGFSPTKTVEQIRAVRRDEGLSGQRR